MDINEYKIELMNEIASISKEKMCSQREAFVYYTTNFLEEMGEIYEFNESYFENIGNNRANILIDGYYYDKIQRELSLVVAYFDEIDVNSTLKWNDVDKLIKQSMNFFKNLDYIIENGEEASLGYSTAKFVKEYWTAFKKLKIVIISNLEVANSKKLKNIKSDDYDAKRVSFSVWGLDRFYRITESRFSQEPSIIHFGDYDEEGILALNASGSECEDYQAYLAIISGNLLSKLYDDYGAKLLEGNVRSFLQNRGKVNKAIRATLISQPDKFFAFNNGIAATANSVKTTEKNGKLYITEVENFQIVNGGQTTASIFNVKYIERKSNLLGVYVPMKLSVIDNKMSETLIPEIAKTANTQNKVSAADFFSNHPFHIKIKDISRRLWAPEIDGNQYKTIWFYERVRGEYRSEMMKMTKAESNRFMMLNPKNQKITKTDLAKFYNSIFGYPYEVSKGAQRNFTFFSELTAKKWIKNNFEFNEEYYKKIIVGKIIFNSLEKMVSNATWYEKAFRANIVTYSIAIFFGEIEAKFSEKAFNYDTIWKIQKLPSKLIRIFKNITYSVFLEITRDVYGRTKNVTEWCKKKDCWIEMKKNMLVKLDGIDSFLVDGSEIIEKEKKIKKEEKEYSKINVQIEVVNKGGAYWEKVMDFGIKNKLLFGKNLSILNIAVNMEKSGKVPSENQCKIIMAILNSYIEEGFKA